jgi:hypothetical protein
MAATIDGCRADLSAYWRWSIRTVQNEIDSGRVIYNQEGATACLNAIRSAPCPSSSNGWRPFAFGCWGDFQGTIATGEACFSDIECASGHCRWTLDQADSCSSACCAGTCAALVDVGASCFTYDYSSDCVHTDYCNGPAPVSNGTCQARLAQGVPCDVSGISAEEPCQDGLTCDNDLLTCVPFPKDGQPCTAYSCDNYDSYCDPTRGTCQARLKIGAPCANNGDPGCVVYAQCLNGTCTLAPGAGDACTMPDDGGSPGSLCRWGATQCIDGICQEPAGPPPVLCTFDDVPSQDAGAVPPDAPASQAIDGGPVACLAYGLAFGVGEAYRAGDSPCVYTCLADGSWGISDCGADQ